MKSILFFSWTAVLFSICSFAVSEELPPLRYEYQSQYYQCSIADFEKENDLDFFKGYQGCLRTGTEIKDYLTKRLNWRNNPHDFKAIQLEVTGNKFKDVFEVYSWKTLKNDVVLRDKLKCYLTMFDNVDKENENLKKFKLQNLDLVKIFNLQLLPDRFFQKVFRNYFYRAPTPDESMSQLNDLIKKYDFKNIQFNELKEVLNRIVETKRLDPQSRLKKLQNINGIIEASLKENIDISFEDLYSLADENDFFPLIRKDLIEKQRRFTYVDPFKIQPHDILIKVLDGDSVSQENKCSLIKGILDYVNDRHFTRHREMELTLISAIIKQKIPCGFEYENAFKSYDGRTKEFTQKWCYQKDVNVCVEGLRERNLPLFCNRHSDCIKTKVDNCGYFFSNTTDITHQVELFKYWCGEKNVYTPSFLQPNAEVICRENQCQPKRVIKK